MKMLLAILITLTLSGCVKAISDQNRALIDPTINYDAVQTAPDRFLGKHLLVGGRILSSQSTNELSRLEIRQIKVDSDGVPFDVEASGGRFFAESATYYDNSVYAPGSMVTLVGEVTGKRQQEVDGQPQTYPVLTIKEIYLWDPDKFGGRKSARDDNPYVNTHDKPLPERPLEPLIHRRY